jgi:hypothetical protein
MYSRKLLMMGRERCPKHVEFCNRINLDNWCVWLVIWKEIVYFICTYTTLFISRVACWPLVPTFAGSNPAEAVGFLRAKKILSIPSFGGEVKPSVPCRRYAACKRSLNGAEVVISAKLPGNILAHSSTFRRWDLPRRGGRGGTWWRKLERLNAGKAMANYP